MTMKAKSHAGNVAPRENGGRKQSIVCPHYIIDAPQVQPDEEMGLVCWYRQGTDGLTGAAYLAMLTLVLQHIEVAEVAG